MWYYMSEPLRLSGVYWANVALELLGESMETEPVIEFVKKCQNSDGIFPMYMKMSKQA